ncbi:hypothetical protein DIPPA_08967 [Diplonema papillatum]|nr:hypothetical protein DIPPA_08967 [Diplonema papillatum]
MAQPPEGEAAGGSAPTPPRTVSSARPARGRSPPSAQSKTTSPLPGGGLGGATGRSDTAGTPANWNPSLPFMKHQEDRLAARERRIAERESECSAVYHRLVVKHIDNSYQHAKRELAALSSESLSAKRQLWLDTSALVWQSVAKRQAEEAMATAMRLKEDETTRHESLSEREAALAQGKAALEIERVDCMARWREGAKRELEKEFAGRTAALDAKEADFRRREAEAQEKEKTLDADCAKYAAARERLLFEYADLAEKEHALEIRSTAASDTWRSACDQQATVKLYEESALRVSRGFVSHVAALAETCASHAGQLASVFVGSASSAGARGSRDSMSPVARAPSGGSSFNLSSNHHPSPSLAKPDTTLPLGHTHPGQGSVAIFASAGASPTHMARLRASHRVVPAPHDRAAAVWHRPRPPADDALPSNPPSQSPPSSCEPLPSRWPREEPAPHSASPRSSRHGLAEQPKRLLSPTAPLSNRNHPLASVENSLRERYSMVLGGAIPTGETAGVGRSVVVSTSQCKLPAVASQPTHDTQTQSTAVQRTASLPPPAGGGNLGDRLRDRVREEKSGLSYEARLRELLREAHGAAPKASLLPVHASTGSGVSMADDWGMDRARSASVSMSPGRGFAVLERSDGSDGLLDFIRGRGAAPGRSDEGGDGPSRGSSSGATFVSTRRSSAPFRDLTSPKLTASAHPPQGSKGRGSAGRKAPVPGSTPQAASSLRRDASLTPKAEASADNVFRQIREMEDFLSNIHVPHKVQAP